MALVSVADFKASREAKDQGVETVDDPTITAALADAEYELYETIGYRIDGTGITSVSVYGGGRRKVALPERAITLSSVTEEGATVVASEYRRSVGGFYLERIYDGWGSDTSIVVTGTFGFAEGERKREIAQRVIRKAVALDLAQTRTSDNYPTPSGGYLTGVTSEGTSFNFFTPSSGEVSSHPELDRLVRLLMHPAKGTKKSLKSVALVGASEAREPFPNQNA